MNIKNARGDNEPSLMTPQVLTKSYNSSVIEIYLDGEISDPDRYREAYHALSNAAPQDMILLHINTVGGRMDAGIQIINHIRRCEATVVGVLHMECASMGSAIFLACDDWELNTFSTMMIHSCSYGAVGKQSDVLSRVEFSTKFNEKYIRETYTGFLNEDEIRKVLKGDDLYFDAEQIDKRLAVFTEERERKENEVVEKATIAAEKATQKAKPRAQKKPK